MYKINFRMLMYYVYMIRNSQNKLYVGMSKDPESRLVQHNTGRGSKYAKPGSFKLIFSEKHSDIKPARKREIQIKKWSRSTKERLVEMYQISKSE